MDLSYPVTRYLYRPVSQPMANMLARTSITPVQVTLLSAAFLMGGAVAFALDEMVIGALLILFGAVTDCVDGDLARVTGRTSRWGAYLDSVLDRWTDGAAILGLWVAQPKELGAVAGLALLGSLLTSYTRARAQSLGVDVPDGIGSRDVRLLVIVMAALLGEVFIGLVIVAVLTTITSVLRTVIAARGLREIDRKSD